MLIKRVIKTIRSILKIAPYGLTKKKKVFMLNTPSHGNLGDQALAYAEELFFKKEFSELIYIEICGNELNKVILLLLRVVIHKNDIICIQAGGYLGNLWLHEEYRIRKILKIFKQYNIIIFPQTVYYSKDKKGLEELKKSIQIYNYCDNLTLCARERKSFDFMNRNYNNCNILLIPDMATYLPCIYERFIRNGCLLCMRNDLERTCSNKMLDEINTIMKKHFNSIRFTDTVTSYNIPKKDRKVELIKKWKEFSKVEVVITDRLHGMIFSLITNTPCIVIPSKSHKVVGVYEWIKSNNFIIICDDMSELETTLSQVLGVENKIYNKDEILPKFSPLIQKIRSIGEEYE